jgi:TrmH family RNA methyltransferase
MTEYPILSKTQVKFIRSLSNSDIRKQTNRILVEGIKCCEELINSEYEVDYIVVNSDNKDVRIDLLIKNKAYKREVKVFQVKGTIFETLCDTKSPQSIICIAVSQHNSIIDNHSFIALDNISDPGNVGTIIRTANWFGIKQIILYGKCADKYSPKVIRASMGSIFKMNVISIKTTSFLMKCIADIPLYAASLDGTIEINELKPAKIYGLIVGNESHGISSELKKIITQSFYINGSGNAESLNVSIATGIALFYLTNRNI